MSVKFCATRSLPPLVEGKIHGYVDLMIDEIIWSENDLVNNNSVIIVANWWGEVDSARFKPLDINNYDKETNILTTYAVKTNIELFKEYLKNCENLELVVMREDDCRVLGTAKLTNLLSILTERPLSQYLGIFNEDNCRLGDIHVTLSLVSLHLDEKSMKKSKKYCSKSTKTIDKESPKANLLETTSMKPRSIEDSTNYHNTLKSLSINNLHNNSNNTYRSILKEKRHDFNSARSKLSSDITDKLVAQVVARAQKLRGAMLSDTNISYDEDDDDVDNNDLLGITEHSSLKLSESSSDCEAENEATLYKYFMGKNMSKLNEKKALKTLRSYSPTQSLIDFATETIYSCKNEVVPGTGNNKYSSKLRKYEENEKQYDGNCMEENNNYQANKMIINKRVLSPIDYVDSLRIAVESLTLTSAGYRRVKSSCLPRGDELPISVTYFVQYNAMFGNNNNSSIKKSNNKKSMNDNKPTKMTSKKQIGQVIYFNHESVYDLQKSYLQMDMPLKFNIYNRHLNQRTPSELGVGTVYIGDASRSPTLSTTQRLAIIKKGIKIGELKVTIELGSDKIHFGKNFVEAVTSTKENIPVLDLSSNSSYNPSIKSGHKFKMTTGNTTGSSSGIKKNNLSDNSRDSNTRNNNNNNNENKKSSNNDARCLKIKVPKCVDDKLLLNGLIYIAEGKNIPATSTYLICRGFWREDRASSQVCHETTSPSYNFHQIVPLINGPELLERTKDNCIITEVYAKNPSGEDFFIGIAKLPVNQLYMAFKDPLVLPHLLKSKYPVISVDGWVTIIDPVSGKLCGQVMALVALGTAEQIALLEMIRGLPVVTTTQSSANRESKRINQECQTEGNVMATSVPMQIEKQEDTLAPREDNNSSVLNAIVDRLAQALTVPKTIINQQVQTSFELLPDEKSSHQELNQDNFMEIHRSMGVGAEFEEPVDQPQSIANEISTGQGQQVIEDVGGQASSKFNTGNEKINEGDTGKLVDDDDDDNRGENELGGDEFRILLEIDCALHLPQVEKTDPCTYVSYQSRKYKSIGKNIGADFVTDVCVFNCNPKYDWRCEMKVPSDLMINHEKKLILNVSRLVDPARSMEVDLTEDCVVGFASVDLTVLTSGFPMVAGWFHIVDSTGKCNGQLKVSVTPLDDVSILRKVDGNLAQMMSPVFDDASTFPPLYHQQEEQPQETPLEEESPINSDPVLNIGFGFGDASMSFLSLSLNQKLGELDEIKKRLQSRLEGVTSTAFEDDFENDFEIPEDDEDYDDNNGNTGNHPAWLKTPDSIANVPKQESNNKPVQQVTSENNSSETTLTDTGYSSSTNTQFSVTNGYHRSTKEEHVNGFINNSQFTVNKNLNGNTNNEEIFLSAVNEDNKTNIIPPAINDDYPTRGTRMHISHLLEQLSTQLTSPQSLPAMTNPPMKRNIMDLISSLRKHNNNYSNDLKCNREANVCTVPTQTESNYVNNSSLMLNNQVSSEAEVNQDDEIPAKTQKIISDDNNSIGTNVCHVDRILGHSSVGDCLEINQVLDDSRRSLASTPDNTIDVINKESLTMSRNAELKINKSESSRVTLSGLSENIDRNVNLTVIEKSGNDDVMANNSMESTISVISLDNAIQTDTDIDENISINLSATTTTTSVSNVSRQAPDGGNPIEDPSKINSGKQSYLDDNPSTS